MSESILYCKCVNTEYISVKSKNIFESILKSAENNLFVSDDLCGLISGKSSELIEFISENEKISVIACNPRAVKWLLFKAGVPEHKLESYNYFNFNKTSFVSILESLSYKIKDDDKNKLNIFQNEVSIPLNNEKNINNPVSEREIATQVNDNSARPWFPVVDYNRCEKCGACMDFCLFGVFEKNEEARIEVKRPENCKDNCPACARVCPHNAIIFPKYDKPPVNGDLSKEDVSGKHRKPIFSLSGDELYKALSRRNTNNKKLYKE